MVTVLLIFFITLPTTILADVQQIKTEHQASKSWTQKAKEFLTNKKVIAGMITGAAVIVSIISGVVYNVKQEQKKIIASEKEKKEELESRGYYRPRMSTEEHKKLVEELTPHLKELHVKPRYIATFSRYLNKPVELGRGGEDPVLLGVIEAKPIEDENPQEYYAKKLEIVQKLIKAGSYPNTSVIGGFGTILGVAVVTKQNEIAKYLIDHDALIVENRIAMDDVQVLRKAIQGENWDMVSYMLKNGLKVMDWDRVLNRSFRDLNPTPWNGQGQFVGELFAPDKKAEMIAELQKIPEVPQDKLDQYLKEPQ